VLVYPAYLEDKAGGASPELNLTAAIPPTLIVHTEDDKTHVVGSKIYDAALTAAKVPHEFAFYPTAATATACIAKATPRPGPTTH
jgi:acetyl esterase/lipase